MDNRDLLKESLNYFEEGKYHPDNEPGYTYYVLVKGSRKSAPMDWGIDSGWEYKEDAQDQKNELLDPSSRDSDKEVKIAAKVTLKRLGLDADTEESWRDI